MPKYIDIHAHINFQVFDEDKDKVLKNTLEGDTWIINVGTQFDTSKKAVEIASSYKEGVFATIGLHPIHTESSFHDHNELGEEGKEFVSRGEIFDKEKYKELARMGKVVAIGECGLDYYHLNEDSQEKQKTAFVSQIELADDLDIPLMLHIRNNPKDNSKNAYFDVYELIKKYSKRYKDKKLVGVSHFFAGSVEDMERFKEIGVYISFAGPITYPPKIEICDYVKVIKETPLDIILADTDSPYVAPVPFRGKRNEPLHVREIVKKIAEIKEIKEEKMAEIIVSNAKRLFDI